jgi:hypothetical protein
MEPVKETPDRHQDSPSISSTIASMRGNGTNRASMERLPAMAILHGGMDGVLP